MGKIIPHHNGFLEGGQVERFQNEDRLYFDIRVKD